MAGNQGRRAVVTGASSGIGAAIAADLRAHGVEVLGLDRSPDTAGHSLQVDLALVEGLDTVVAEATAALGGVDILVNCAGTFYGQAALEVEWENYDYTLRVNLHTPVFLMKLFGAAMSRQGYGRIVNITSVHGRFSEPLSTAYDVSKGGLTSATRTFALELAEHGVLVNAVAPGFVSTPLSIVDGENELESGWFQDIYVAARRLPMQRAAAPAEIATVVTFLCSEENSYITGQVVTVDGGLTARF